jgi:hypothetical protein
MEIQQQQQPAMAVLPLFISMTALPQQDGRYPAQQAQ